MSIQSDLTAKAFDEVTVETQEDQPVVISDGTLLFGADFLRSGPDLLLRNDGADDIRVLDYFRSETPADLQDADGATLPGEWVLQLAGPEAPGQYAQASASASADVIGQVESLGGGASVQRADGTTETLGEGSNIFLGDVVATDRGGKLSITFVDGTIFSLTADSRMVIDELVYTPAGTQNSATFNLIQGGFVFVAGQIAPTGGMEVKTPAATMGIRGTTVLTEIRSVAGVSVSEITLTEDPDTGRVGRIELFDPAGNLLAEVTRTDTKFIITSGGEISEVPRSADDQESDNALLNDLLLAYEEAVIRVEQGGNFVELNRSNATGGNTDAPDQENLGEVPADVELDSEDAPPPPEDVPPPETAPPEEAPFDEGRLESDSIQKASLTVTSTPADAQGLVVEDQTTSTGGQLSATGEAVAWAGSTEGQFGDFEINADGDWNYTANEATEGLAEGQQVDETFTAVVSDEEGASATQDVIVTVTGTNDAPVVISQSEAARGTITENTSPNATGTLVAQDADVGAVLSWTGSSQGVFGDFQISTDGDWVYATTDQAESLAVGETATETFTATVSDDAGATVDQVITINLTGTNDAPVIQPEIGQQKRVIEDIAPTVTGQLTASDIDAGTTLSWSASTEGVFGSFTIDDTGFWTYTAGPTAEGLSAGQEETDVITVTVSDGQGGNATIDVSVKLTGTNDAPVITSSADDATGSIDISLVTTVNGQLSAADPDLGPASSQNDDARTTLSQTSDADTGAALVWSGTAAGSLGDFAISQTGAWTYTASAAAEALAAGQSATETFTATVTDDQGATATQTVTITLTGTNDAPVVTSAASNASGQVTENTAPATAGQLAASDADTGAALVWSGTAAGSLGDFAISQTGAWTYTASAAAEALAAGQSATETFTATVTDDQGATATQTVTITLTGTNDAPVVTSAASNASGQVTENTAPATAGQLAASDADTGAALVWSGTAAGSLGDFAISQTGAWTYTASAAAEALAAGQSATETFTATVTDDQGATATQTVTITLTGTNDAPVVTSAASNASGQVTENTAPATAGQLAASDADTGAALVWSGTAAGSLGDFAISQTGAWTYTASAAAEALAAGQSATETFTATVTDDQGATATQTVTITLTGTNDAPVVTSAASNASGQVTENTAPATAGQLAASDADTGAALVWSGTAAGSLGDFAISQTGAWTYTASAAAEALAAGQSATETFTATVTDDQGATATQTVTITLTGTNDAPVVTSAASNASGQVTENTAPATAGQLAASDADTGAALVWSGTAAGSLGDFAISQTGAWTYTASAAAEALAAGQSATETFTATVTDDQGATATQTVTITLTGTNDAPVVTSAASNASGQVTENTAPATAGQLAASDADTGAALVWSGTAAGSLGDFAISQTGAWTYTASAAAEALAAGQSATETFTATVTDDQGATATQTVTITLTGTNDAPVVTSAATLKTEAAPVSGQLTFTDVDATDTHTFVGVGDGPGNGTPELETNGQFTYEPDAGFFGTDSFEYDVVDSGGGTTRATMTVLVDSAPVNLVNGAALDIDILDHSVGGRSVGHVLSTTTENQDFEVNVVVAVDASAAVTSDEWAAQLPQINDALQRLASVYSEVSTPPVNVHLVTFAGTAQIVGTFDLNGFELADQVGSLVQAGGTADLTKALEAVDAALAGASASAANYVYVFSGDATPLPAFAAQTDYDLELVKGAQGNIPTTQFSNVTLSSFGIDPTDAAPVQWSFNLISDGTDHGEIAGTQDLDFTLSQDGPVFALADIPGLADLFGDANILSVKATFAPLDGDIGLFELGASEVFDKAQEAQTQTGTDQADLILGSDDADNLTSGAGDDILLGYAGDDTLNAGTGVDTVKAGAGDDIIRLNTSLSPNNAEVDGGLGRDVLALEGGNVGAALDAIDLSGIEAIDIDNGDADAITLTLADVLGLSDTADTELEQLLGAALPDSLTILGDGNDTVTLAADANGAFAATGQSVTAADGTDLDIYTYSNGSDVLATLGVDADVTVATQAVVT